MDHAEQVKIWKAYVRETARASQEWRERGYRHPPPRYPVFPPECMDMRCGARTRKGTPCKRKDIYRSGRCRLHGGLSTGPKTAEGKAKVGRRKKDSMSS